MKPWQLLVPNLALTKPVWSIYPELMASYGLQGMVLDVDNTLLGSSEWEVSPQVKNWLTLVRSDLKLWLVSNNCFQKRIQYIAESLELPFYCNAAKPSRRCVRLALAGMQLPAHRVAMVGDRLFTDIVVGNRLGMFTILIHPPVAIGPTSKLVRESEFWLARLSGISL